MVCLLEHAILQKSWSVTCTTSATGLIIIGRNHRGKERRFRASPALDHR